MESRMGLAFFSLVNPISLQLYMSLKLSKDSCQYIDCGGDQPQHSSDCQYMVELTYAGSKELVEANAIQIQRIVETCAELKRLNKICQQRHMKRLKRDKSRLRGKIVSLAQELTIS